MEEARFPVCSATVLGVRAWMHQHGFAKRDVRSFHTRGRDGSEGRFLALDGWACGR